jgi:hypothetical protein
MCDLRLIGGEDVRENSRCIERVWTRPRKIAQQRTICNARARTHAARVADTPCRLRGRGWLGGNGVQGSAPALMTAASASIWLTKSAASEAQQSNAAQRKQRLRVAAAHSFAGTAARVRGGRKARAMAPRAFGRRSSVRARRGAHLCACVCACVCTTVHCACELRLRTRS